METEGWQGDFQSMPYARTFFAECWLQGVTAVDLLRPDLAMKISNEAVGMAGPWAPIELNAYYRAAHQFDDAIWRDVEVLAGETARTVGWMQQPLSESAQVLTYLEDDYRFMDEQAVHTIEVCTSRPYPTQVTSTLWPGGVTAYTEGARAHAGTLPYVAFPFVSDMIRVGGEDRVYEVNWPHQWQRLCERFPHVTADGSMPNWPLGWRLLRKKVGGAVVTPEWNMARRELDAIHMTFLGILTVSSVPMETRFGLARLLSFDAESTYWLNPPMGTWQEITLE